CTMNHVQTITRSVVRSCSKVVDSETAWRYTTDRKKRVEIAENIVNYILFAGVTLGCMEVREVCFSQTSKYPIPLCLIAGQPQRQQPNECQQFEHLPVSVQ